MHRDKDSINLEIRKLLKDLNSIALEDKKITSDEQAILDKINFEAGNLKDQVTQILESDLEDGEFQDLLVDILLDVVNNVTLIAKEDGIITNDEMKLLNRIQSFVDEFKEI